MSDSSAAPLRTMAANPGRGLATIGCYALVACGLGLWISPWAGVFGLGVVVWLDVTIDEAVERVTGVKRGGD